MLGVSNGCTLRVPNCKKIAEGVIKLFNGKSIISLVGSGVNFKETNAKTALCKRGDEYYVSTDHSLGLFKAKMAERK